MKKKIQKMIEQKKFARITRQVPKKRLIVERGYFIKASNKLAILRECNDFILSGYILFPIHQIQKIRYNSNDAFYDKIVTDEGLKKGLTMKSVMDISDWETVFNNFQQLEKSIIIECENSKFSDFFIGKIIKISNKRVWIHNFNAQGVLDKKPTKLKLKDITRVTFDDRYAEVFEKYVRPKQEKSYNFSR